MAASDVNEDTSGLAKCLLAATCSRCNHVFDSDEHNPRLLPCLHVVCLDCLCQLVADDHFVCPVCKTRHEVQENDISIFPCDKTKQEFIEIMKLRNEPRVICDFCDQNCTAAFRCQDCSEYLCPECNGFHLRYKRYKHHKVVSLQSLTTSEGDDQKLKYKPYCPISGHNSELLTLYCNDPECQRPICSKCALSDIGAGHKVTDLDEVYDEHMTALKSMDNDLNFIHKSSEMAISLVQDEMISVKHMSKDATDEVTKVMDDCIEALQKRKAFLLSRVKMEGARKLDVLEEQEETLQSLKLSVEDGRSYMKEAEIHLNRPSFLEISPIITRQFRKLTKTSVDKGANINSNVTFIPSNIKEFLENFADSMGQISSSRAFAPNTRILVPSTVFLGSPIDVLVQLRDRHDETIEDEDSNVAICLINKKGKMMRGQNQGRQEGDGIYRASFSASAIGTYHVEVTVLGELLNIPQTEVAVIKNKLCEEGMCCYQL